MSLQIEKYSVHQIDAISNLKCELTPRTRKAFEKCFMTVSDVLKLSDEEIQKIAKSDDKKVIDQIKQHAENKRKSNIEKIKKQYDSVSNQQSQQDIQRQSSNFSLLENQIKQIQKRKQKRYGFKQNRKNILATQQKNFQRKKEIELEKLKHIELQKKTEQKEIMSQSMIRKERYVKKVSNFRKSFNDRIQNKRSKIQSRDKQIEDRINEYQKNLKQEINKKQNAFEQRYTLVKGNLSEIIQKHQDLGYKKKSKFEQTLNKYSEIQKQKQKEQQELYKKQNQHKDKIKKISQQYKKELLDLRSMKFKNKINKFQERFDMNTTQQRKSTMTMSQKKQLLTQSCLNRHSNNLDQKKISVLDKLTAKENQLSKFKDHKQDQAKQDQIEQSKKNYDYNRVILKERALNQNEIQRKKQKIERKKQKLKQILEQKEELLSKQNNLTKLPTQEYIQNANLQTSSQIIYQGIYVYQINLS